MKTKSLLIALIISLLTVTSCEEFLDQEPTDSLTEAQYFNDAQDFKSAANMFYEQIVAFKAITVRNNVGNTNIYDFMDRGTDLSDVTSDMARGINIISESDRYWTGPYQWIRNNNVLIEKAAEYEGDQEEIKKYVSAAYFFRAWHHYSLMTRFGGVPVITSTVNVTEDEELYGKRNSRYEVTDQILSDLDVAIEGLPLESQIVSADKGQVSNEAAKAFKARVLLYAATWMKYVGTETDGDGVTSGAGSEGYDASNIEDYLSEAKALAADVISNGPYQLWNAVADDSYYFLFVLEDGQSNPVGATKESNKEYIFYTKYDFTRKQTGTNLSHSWPVSITAEFGESFLCKNGLPIKLGAGYNEQFGGYENFEDEFDNRDNRFTSTVPIPGKKYWGYGAQVDGGGAVYGEDFPAVINPVTPSLRAAGDGSGYGCRKFRCQHKQREMTQESYDFPHIRLAEVYLIYAEATAELQGGAISDADLDFSINKTRARAGVAPLTNALIAPYAELSLLGEIRRERACELFGEGLRWDDVKRWGIAEQILNKTHLGIQVTGTEYETALALDNKPAYDPVEFPLRNGLNADGRVIVDVIGERNFSKRNYLIPLPNTEIQLNPALKQNPGWN